MHDSRTLLRTSVESLPTPLNSLDVRLIIYMLSLDRFPDKFNSVVELAIFAGKSDNPVTYDSPFLPLSPSISMPSDSLEGYMVLRSTTNHWVRLTSTS